MLEQSTFSNPSYTVRVCVFRCEWKTVTDVDKLMLGKTDRIK